MPFTAAQPSHLFSEYQQTAAMRPVFTLAQVILLRTGDELKKRHERELYEAIRAKDQRLIEQKLNELDDLERRIREIPACALQKAAAE